MRMKKAKIQLSIVVMLAGAWATLPATPVMAADPSTLLQSESHQPSDNTAVGRRDADPEAGSVVEDAYANAYFGLTLPLPSGWTEGLAGPPPSARGLYVLASIDGTQAFGATMLIVAEDLFFTAKPFANVADVAADFRAATAAIPDMSIDQRPASIMIGGQTFLRLDYNAGGLYRAWLATELRCHVVSFNITARDRATVDHTADFLRTLSLRPPSETQPASGSDAAPTTPVCIKDYVTAQTTLHRVDPPPTDLNGLTVPVRIIIGADGKVEHVHVINATPAQRQAIEQALPQWQFKPFEVMGHPTAVETGLTFAFRSQR
jgi:Gram-negative bacterial TonB protein C-terminal